MLSGHRTIRRGLRRGGKTCTKSRRGRPSSATPSPSPLGKPTSLRSRGRKKVPFTGKRLHQSRCFSQALPLWFSAQDLFRRDLPSHAPSPRRSCSATRHLALGSRCRPGASRAAATTHTERRRKIHREKRILHQSVIQPATKSPTNLRFYTRHKLPLLSPPPSCIGGLLPPPPCCLDTGGSWSSTSDPGLTPARRFCPTFRPRLHSVLSVGGEETSSRRKERPLLVCGMKWCRRGPCPHPPTTDLRFS